MYYTFPGSQPHLGTLVIFCMVTVALLLIWDEMR